MDGSNPDRQQGRTHRLGPRLQAFVAATSLAFSALAAGAGQFYVSPTGSDAHPGTEPKPFATLAKALDAARAAPGPDAIWLAPGRHVQAEPLVLDERDSGLTIQGAQPGAVAAVYGGLPVTGWERWKGDIWRAPVPKGERFFNLVVDGRPATMAQTPDAGSGFGGGAWKINNGAVGVPADWRGYDYSDAQVFCFIGANWFSEMREVTAAAPDANGVLPIDGGAGQLGGMNGRFFLRGVLEFLDEPGEWCLKHEDGFVYYWPFSGTPGDHVIVRPTGQRLFDITGRAPATPARNITLANLALIGSDFCARWYLFRQPKDGTTPAPLQQGMVFGENVERLSVKNCRLLAAGHSAVWLNHHAQDCVVENNLIQGAGFAGVYMNGWDMGEGPFTNAAASYVNKGHRIENNFIYDCGKFVGAGCGIQFYQSGDNLIARNEIGQMPRYGISYKGNRWGNMQRVQYGKTLTFETHFDTLHTRRNRIVGNEIYSVCRNSFDFGGIECWSPGRDNLWASNAVHDIDQALDWDGWAHVLFADDSSHWLTMRDNIIDHCHGGRATGAFMMKSLNQVIENNFVADCTLGRVVSLNAYIEPGGNYVIRRNVFASDGQSTRYDPSPEVFTGFAGTRGTLPPDVGGIIEVNYNLIDPLDPQHPNPLIDKGVDTNSVFGDPKLRRAQPDWDLTFRDYALAPDSPAFKLGFQPIDAAAIGLRPDFPFDQLAATRRRATGKIQAEDYQRMHALRTSGGHFIYQMGAGSWAKYANVDFGSGVTQAVFQLDAPVPAKAAETFIRRYGEMEVAATRFVGGTDTIIAQWEVSDAYTMTGKTGVELFDISFAPEKDIKAGTWKPWLAPMTSRRGLTSAPGVVDLDVANGENNVNACAYLRCSIHIPSTTGNQNTTAFTVKCAAGVKLWVNGELVLAVNRPGTHKTVKDVALKDGWNTLLMKVNQDDKPRGAGQEPCDNLHAKLGAASSFWPTAVYLPGLPTEEKAMPAAAGTLLELRLDAPTGKLIGRLAAGRTECPVGSVAGIHNLFLVFPGNQVKTLDWIRFD